MERKNDLPIHASNHVQESFRIAIGLKKEQSSALPEVPSDLQRLFLRNEEYECTERDQWDNWEHGYSENYKQGNLWVPQCDVWMHTQKQLLKQQGIELAPLWPNGHKFAVCLTHDVDYIGETLTFNQRGREFLRSIKAHDLLPERKLFGSMKSLAKMFLRRSSLNPLTENTLEISYKIEKEFGVTASYFFTIPPESYLSKYDCLYKGHDRCYFLGKSCQVKDVMSHFVQEGFDVGLHGSYFSASKEGLLAEQKAGLEKQINAPIFTTRQHWLHLNLPKTLNFQEQAGFQADTTMGFNRNIGYRAGTGLPFFAYDLQNHRQLSLIETPLVIQDGALLGENALEYSPYKAMDIVKTFTSQTSQVEGCLTLLFHPDIFMKPGLAPLYRSIIKHCLSQNAWVTDLNTLQNWWRSRAKELS